MDGDISKREKEGIRRRKEGERERKVRTTSFLSVLLAKKERSRPLNDVQTTTILYPQRRKRKERKRVERKKMGIS